MSCAPTETNSHSGSASSPYPSSLGSFVVDQDHIGTNAGRTFIARDFKTFIRIAGMTHVRTAPYYPQSNGKIERWHKTLKVTTSRPKAPGSLDEARRIVGAFVEHYNTVRLHSAIGYVTPADKLAHREKQIWQDRDRKLEQAREQRRQQRQQHDRQHDVLLHNHQPSHVLAEPIQDETATLRPLDGEAFAGVCQCHVCRGVWVSADVVERMAGEMKLQKKILAEPRLRGVVADDVVPVRCPECEDVLPGQGFEGVKFKVNVCESHGVWFDPGEFRAAASFLWSRPVESSPSVHLRGDDEDETEAAPRLSLLLALLSLLPSPFDPQ